MHKKGTGSDDQILVELTFNSHFRDILTSQ